MILDRVTDTLLEAFCLTVVWKRGKAQFEQVIVVIGCFGMLDVGGIISSDYRFESLHSIVHACPIGKGMVFVKLIQQKR